MDRRTSYLVSILIALFCTLGSRTSEGQTVRIEYSDSIRLSQDLCGVSTEYMYSYLEGILNESTGKYDTLWLREDAMELIEALAPPYLRFPGGTLSQFYHFSGQRGYGSLAEEMECRPGYLPVAGFSNRVRVDSIMPKNMIHYYVDMVKQLESSGGETVGTYYVLNVMTHFFQGDLVPLNPMIDSLINLYSTGLLQYLNVNPSSLDTTVIGQLVNRMYYLSADPAIGQAIVWLVQQPGFFSRFLENLSAIQFLLDNDLTVTGIELGNENYAFNMLKDDDLSEYPYDCTTPDSIVNQYQNFFIPVRAYMQAIIKNAIVCSMYAEAIRDEWGIPTGFVIDPLDFSIRTTGTDEFQYFEYSGEKSKYFEIFNRYAGKLNFYDAVIPHIYTPNQPECDLLDGTQVDTLDAYFKYYLDYYFNEALPYQLGRLSDQTGGKPMWISEWNINTAGLFKNTFSHASHFIQYLSNMDRLADRYNVTSLTYHLLLSYVNQQFGLIRADPLDDQDSLSMTLQVNYFPYQWTNMDHRNNLRIATIYPDEWGGSSASPPDIYLFAGYDPDNQGMILYFINQTDSELDIPLSELDFRLYRNGTDEGLYEYVSYSAGVMDAESFLSSDRGCTSHPEYFDDYTVYETSGNESHFALPARSLGRLYIQVQPLVDDIGNHELSDWMIYPNPSNGNLKVVVEQGDYSFEISNLAGQQILVKDLPSDGGIRVQNLPDGFYNLQLTDKTTGNTGTKMLVITSK